MKRLALVVFLTGCTIRVTSLDVHVTAPSSITLDQLRLYAALEYGPLAQVEPSSAQQLTLPFTFTAYLPDLTQTAQIAIEGINQGFVRASGLDTSVAVVAHSSSSIDLALALRCDPHGSTCRGDELFCDGFEDALTAWTPVGSPMAEPTVVCDGLGSLGLSSSSPQYVQKTGLALASKVYLRTHLYLPSKSALPATQLLALTDGSSTLSVAYEQSSGTFTSTYGGSTSTFTGVVSLDRWVCVKVEATLDPTDGGLLVSVDDAEAGRVTHVPTAPASGYTTLEAGLVSTTGTASFYLDDVAISTAPLPCD